ncbi:MAG: TldD/PmbA family protein [Thermoleophilia bacterium]
MKDFATDTLSLLDRRGVEYADVRVVLRRTEHLRVKNGVLEAWSDEEELGFGVRVLAGGAWGFAAAADLDREEAARTAARALAVARASASVGGPRAVLAHQRPHVADVTGPVEEDPFALSVESKLALLLQAVQALRAPGVTFAVGHLGAMREEKVFASTEGALIRQTRVEAGGGIQAVAVREGDVQTRSYPSAGAGTWGQGGFEVVRALDLASHAPRLAEEAVALLDAPPCPQAITTVILDQDQMALQVHESVGHPTELDRILGSEVSYAGTSFLTVQDLGRLRYGSEQVNIVADATTPGGVGSAPFDDEGVPAQRVPLIRHGRLVGLLTSRETAILLGQESGGAMRASSWNRVPLIRMTNINLEPGDWRLDDLIADTEDGVLMATNKSWSIDDRRLNFHFATEIGWEITKGRLGRMLRDCTYTGTTPIFWAGCDAVCGGQDWRLFGITNCGKGEPGQTIHVGHGVAPARFRGVTIGRSGGGA